MSKPPEPAPDPPVYGPFHRRARPAAELDAGAAGARWSRGTGPSILSGPSEAGSFPAALRPHPGLPRQRLDHASWGRRALGSLVDALPGWLAVAVLLGGYAPTYRGFFRSDITVAPRYPLVVAGCVLGVGALALGVYNRSVLAGRTGQSVGRRLTGTWLVRGTTGRPLGTLDAFVRDLLHVLDVVGGIGYLWPLWDEERQTLADKVAQTVVVRTPVPPLTDVERRTD